MIVNTTSLIALANVGKRNILEQVHKEIVIPQVVLDEIKSEPAKTLVANSK